jgi:hypothetical protein
MNQAIYAATGNPVYVLAVNGGWSTIRDVNGQESKVRNSALHPVLTYEAAVQTAKAEQIKAESKAESKAKYAGPMLALRTAAKSYYVGSNGNPHCGDVLAAALSGLAREQVVEVLIYALGLPGNPYAHLNPGQQSMNLRNKARVAMKAGTLRTADIELAVHECTGLGITI